MATLHILQLAQSLLLFLAAKSQADLPYNPTRIFLTPKTSGIFAYVVDPPSTTTPQGQLRGLSTTSTLDFDNLPSYILSTSLPFLQNDVSAAFTPVLSDDGSIIVYTGNCSAEANESALWSFTTNTPAVNGAGSWSVQSYTMDNAATNQVMARANYLAAGMHFMADLANPGATYIFGGMCPFANSTSGTWTSVANYSNQMLVFGPQPTSAYLLSLVPSQGKPIAEAGLSIVPLQPTFSNASDGTQTQQRDFLLIGGHTQTAFIDMTQVALFSLPQASWTFLAVNAPSDQTDLMTRTVAQVQPRSGHTAVLTPDGKRIIVFGGWVGDVATAADPQLVILEVGRGYGGTGDWSWSIPSASGFSLASGAGIYGHGAVILPGNIMMVVGGYSIPANTSSRVKKADQTSNTRNLFYNVSSNSWVSFYGPVSAYGTPAAEAAASGALATSSQKAGLGAGLAFGLLALLLASLAGWIYSRRLKRKRSLRATEISEKGVNDLSMARQYDRDGYYGGGGIDGLDGDLHGASHWDRRNQTANGAYSLANQGSDNVHGWNSPSRGAARTGLDFDVPSPHRGLRRSLHGRGNYHVAPRYEEVSVSHGSGGIHPIAEGDEDATSLKTNVLTMDAFVDVSNLDPFSDPDPIGSALEDKYLRRVPTRVSRTGWIKDWPVAESIVHNNGRISPKRATIHGRISPDKSDRTGSNLSDSSTRSNVSARSGGATNHFGAHLTSSGPTVFISANPSPTCDAFPIPRSSTASRPSTSSVNDRDGFMHAHPTFATLQAESEALLGTTTATYIDLPIQPDTEPTFTRPTNLARYSPTRTTSHTHRIYGWVGSVRRAVPRALSVGGRSASLTLATTRTELLADPHGGYTDCAEYIDERSTASSPTKTRRRRGPPFDAGTGVKNVRRSVSDGASLLVGRRGGKNLGLGSARGEYTVGPGTSSRYGEGSEDGDVESAVEGRVVQVMYMAPRERLRVVNADVEAERGSVSEIGDGEVGGEEKGGDGGLVHVDGARKASDGEKQTECGMQSGDFL